MLRLDVQNLTGYGEVDFYTIFYNITDVIGQETLS